ncbi:MAG: insulinase family protein [Planctomycetes bacterium]|nr:insulinase family protein [Planctomycetota bacterium]
MRILPALALGFLGLTASAQDIAIPYQKFVLQNGLEVIVHEDHSDPVVAVYVYYHVGSGREVPGRSGFAHLFEHMLFQGSQHVGDDQHFKLVAEAGGTLNGSTTEDRTNYFEVLPSNQLELALWLEADRMGFLLPAMTQAKLDNQRDVVKNERRQNYENRPYGQAEGVIAAALYPPDHPYSWLTIGSQEDLSAATLDDVKAFFARWYGPNNATLAIGGDVDASTALALAEKYFGAIPRGPSVDKPLPRPTVLAESKRIVMEDRVKLPQLTFVWPAVPAYSEDAAALDFLASVLSTNKSSVLDKALTIDAELASEVSAFHQASEIAGTFAIEVKPHPGVTLETLAKRIDELLAELDRNGVDPEHLQRVKNRYEAGFVRRYETVSSRTSMLANYNTFLKDPGYYRTDMERHLAVSTDDLRRVLRTYVLGKSRIELSVVPTGKLDAALPGSKSDVKWSAPSVAKEIDRTQKPAAGPAPTFRSPKVWHAKLANGVSVTASPWNELPVSTLSLSVPAGRILETPKTLGLASLVAEMLEQGTQSLSSVAFAEELDGLGASLSVRASDDEITFSLSCLDKHLPKALGLLGEVILAPRFAQEDFARLQKERLLAIDTRGDQIRVLAGDAYRRLLWGEHVLGLPASGTRESVAALKLDDVKGFWRTHGGPNGARLVYVGAKGEKELVELFAPLTARWKQSPTVAEASSRTEPKPVAIAKTRLYLLDKPGAAQSELRIGHPSVSATDPDFYPLQVLNYPLGAAFSSRVNMNLREDKGYTYGARTSFDAGVRPGAFTASAAVKTADTAPSIVEFMKELTKIREGITAEELAFTQDALLSSANKDYESTRALQSLVERISELGYPDDYVDRRLGYLRSVKLADLNALAPKAIHPDAMVILVVGDKAKIGAELAQLGYGEPIELDPWGVPLASGAASR